MHGRPLPLHATGRLRQGFSLLEATLSTMLMGIVMVTALHSVGAAQRRERDASDRVVGQQLASALLSEILLQSYKDAEGLATDLGPETGETIGNRALFDDVDDYSGWSSSPPQDRSGNILPNLDGWTRSVSVGWADPVTLSSTGTSNTGLKKIRVTASRNGLTFGSIVGYRSIAWTDSVAEPSGSSSNHMPVAVATSTTLNRRVGQSVSFSGSQSSDPDGDYLSLVWDFGDGTSGTGASVGHAYTSAGSFTCTLTVYDGRGGTSTSSLTAVISP